jgi:hypothetical protein
MTYGWAILLVILVAGALFALGFFDIGSAVGNKAVGFSEIAIQAFKVDSTGVLTAQFQNQVGKSISIDYVNATYQGTTVGNSSPAITNLGAGATTSTITVGDIGTISSGASYGISLKIGYTDKATNFSYTETGTLNGVVG